jgi:hypothetical protein
MPGKAAWILGWLHVVATGEGGEIPGHADATLNAIQKAAQVLPNSG